MEGGVLMRPQTVGSLEKQATSSCLLLKVSSQIFVILVLFIKVGDSQGGSWFSVERRDWEWWLSNSSVVWISFQWGVSSHTPGVWTRWELGLLWEFYGKTAWRSLLASPPKPWQGAESWGFLISMWLFLKSSVQLELVDGCSQNKKENDISCSHHWN